MTAAEILSRIPLFGDLAPEELEWVAGRGRLRTYGPGEKVFFAGDLGHHVFFVGSGSVKMHLDTDGRDDLFYCMVSPGEFFGEMSLLDGEPRFATATCTETAEIAFLNRDNFFEALGRFPALNRRFLGILARRLRNADDRLEMTTVMDVYGRVASQLLELARLHGVQTDRGAEIRLHLEVPDLALLVGASPESVGWVLNNYESRGYIHRDGYKIVLLDPEGLAKRGG